MGGAASPSKFKDEKQYFEYFNKELKKIIEKFDEKQMPKQFEKNEIAEGKE